MLLIYRNINYKILLHLTTDTGVVQSIFTTSALERGLPKLSKAAICLLLWRVFRHLDAFENHTLDAWSLPWCGCILFIVPSVCRLLFTTRI